MAEVRLRKVLGRYRKGDLERVLAGLGVEGEGTTKRQLIAAAVTKLLGTNATQQDISQLELQYILSHPNSVSWTSYKLHPANELCPADVDNHTFLRRLHLYLGDVCRYELADTMAQSHHWMCIHFEDSGESPYSCFVIRTPPTPFVLVAGARKHHLHCIMEALSVSLECSGWSEAQLSGCNMASLLDLLVHQHSQGPYKAYRHNQVDPNPLLAITKRRRYEDPGAVESNDTDAVKRVKLAEKAFGTNPPTLERFTFKLTDGDSVSCKVKLCGGSVLEGVKQCISLDYLTLPLPPCVANMHSFASNCVTVKDTSISSSRSDTADSTQD